MWKSGFFHSVNGDRAYSAVEISRMNVGIISDGIYPKVGEKLKVTAGSGMTFQIGTGRGYFNERWVENTTVYTDTLEDSDVTLNRYAAICVLIDDTDDVRDGIPYVKYSEFATNPTKPVMTRSESVNEHCLAYIYIGAGVTSITSDVIEDKRDDAELCGYATLLVEAQKQSVWNYEIAPEEWIEAIAGEKYYVDKPLIGLTSEGAPMISMISADDIPTNTEIDISKLLVNSACLTDTLRVIASGEINETIKIQVRL
jgi:hypothetical protein